jgi:RNA polymerase sigma-70 factor (ECF subfamily)
MPQATSVSLGCPTAWPVRFRHPSRAAAEMQIILQEAINSLDLIDHEILALRHFEELSNDETAQVLDLKPSAASNRNLPCRGSVQGRNYSVEQ